MLFGNRNKAFIVGIKQDFICINHELEVVLEPEPERCSRRC